MRTSCEIKKLFKREFQYFIDFEEYEIKCEGKIVVDVRIQSNNTNIFKRTFKMCTKKAEILCDENEYKLLSNYNKLEIIDKRSSEIEFFYPISCFCARSLTV